MKNRKSYLAVSTPSEWMIAIAIIAILASAIFVAIDPVRRLHESRNAQRANDIVVISDAIKQLQADPGGLFKSRIDNLAFGTLYHLGTAKVGCAIPCGHETTQEQCLNLGEIDSRYPSLVPTDPKTDSPDTTGYAFSKDTPDTFSIIACHAEGEGMFGLGDLPQIQVSR